MSGGVRRAVPVLAAAVCALLLLCGCGRREAGAAGGGPAHRPHILHVGNGAEPQDLDPHVVTGEIEYRILICLFEGLVNLDPVDLHPVPGVATHWEASPDGLTWTFHLRPEARWSDGTPLTADDFIASWRRILSPSFGAQYAYLLHCVEGAEDFNRGSLADFSKVGFAADGPHTLRITLRSPVPFLPGLVAYYPWHPVPIKAIAAAGGMDRPGSGWCRPENFVGNGPFVLKEWAPNRMIVVARNPQYWGRAGVRLDEIHFHPVESNDTEERMFRSGQLDITQTIPLSKIGAYRRDAPGKLRIDPDLGVYFYRFNVTRPPLDDVRVRRALALAIDRGAIVRNILRAGQPPALQFTPPGIPGYEPAARLEGGPDEARRLLAEAGFPGGRGFPRLELLYNSSESHRMIAEAVQEMWKRNLGIDITLVNQDWKSFLDAQDRLDYDIARAAWAADYIEPGTFLNIFAGGGGNNDTGWSSPAYDALLREADACADPTARNAIYQKLEQILVDELPVMPVYHYTRCYLISPRVRGWHPTPMSIHPFNAVDVLEDDGTAEQQDN